MWRSRLSSAGAIVGAQVAQVAGGIDPTEMYAGQIAPASESRQAERMSPLLLTRFALAMLACAVDAWTGEFTAFDRDSGVSLVDAVGASCAVPGVWPPVTIDGRQWIDGGMRSVANVDVAAGSERAGYAQAETVADAVAGVWTG